MLNVTDEEERVSQAPENPNQKIPNLGGKKPKEQNHGTFTQNAKV